MPRPFEHDGGSAAAALPVVGPVETAAEAQARRRSTGARQPPLLERHRQVLVLGGQRPLDGVPRGLGVPGSGSARASSARSRPSGSMNSVNTKVR